METIPKQIVDSFSTRLKDANRRRSIYTRNSCRLAENSLVLDASDHSLITPWFCKSRDCYDCGSYLRLRSFTNLYMHFSDNSQMFAARIESSQQCERIRKYVKRHDGKYVTMETHTNNKFLFTGIPFPESRVTNFPVFLRFLEYCFFRGGRVDSTSRNASIKRSNSKAEYKKYKRGRSFSVSPTHVSHYLNKRGVSSSDRLGGGIVAHSGNGPVTDIIAEEYNLDIEELDRYIKTLITNPEMSEARLKAK